MHKICGEKKCPFDDDKCKYDHPKNIAKNDVEWAKARKRAGRDHSPHVGSCASVSGESDAEKKRNKNRRRKGKKGEEGQAS